MKTKSTTIYPMSMLEEVVGNEEKIKKESERYEFRRKEKYFHYEEGKILESLTESLADYAVEELGYTKFVA